MCHAFNGTGITEAGKGMYPPAPNLRAAATQALSDGEMLYIIKNGIRFTGMPGWEMTDDQIWPLVTFIRRLPQLSDQQIEKLKGEASPSNDAHTH